jgi:hypothetical protein
MFARPHGWGNPVLDPTRMAVGEAPTPPFPHTPPMATRFPLRFDPWYRLLSATMPGEKTQR